MLVGSTGKQLVSVPNYALVRLQGVGEPRRIDCRSGFFPYPQCDFQAREVIEIQVWALLLA